jgi:hypothetical protein
MDVSPCVIERLLAGEPNQTEAYADGIAGQCPLCIRKRTFLGRISMSALGHKQTLQAQLKTKEAAN